MKPTKQKTLKWCKCLVLFYLVSNCIAGLSIAVYGCYLMLFHQTAHIYTPKIIVLYFLIFPTLLCIFSTIIGWIAIKKKNTKLLKFFAILLGTTALVEFAGCLWCFISLPSITEAVGVQMEEKFTAISDIGSNDTWWSNVETKLKCCGLHGHTDYLTKKGVPISCCGYDSDDGSKGSCSFMWRRGCSAALSREVAEDLITISLLSLIIGFFQVPGVFISWCFANRLNKGRI